MSAARGFDPAQPAPSGQTHLLDLSDDAQHAHLLRLLDASGVAEEGNDVLFSAVREARRGRRRPRPPRPPALADQALITSFGLSADGTESLGSALSSLVEGTLFTWLHLQVVDTASGEILGEARTGPVYGGGRLETVSVRGRAPTTPAMQLVFTYGYQSAPSTQPVFGTVRLSAGGVPPVPPQLWAPAPAPGQGRGTRLRIGLGAGYPAPGLDYWYQERKPDARLPLVGCQAFGSEIVTPLFGRNGSPQNLQVQLVMVDAAGGGAPPARATLKELKNAVAVSPDDPRLLTWSFPWSPAPRRDGSVRFGAAPFGGDACLPVLRLGVRTADSGDDWVYTSVYGDAAGPYSPAARAGGRGIWVLRPVQYLQG